MLPCVQLTEFYALCCRDNHGQPAARKAALFWYVMDCLPLCKPSHPTCRGATLFWPIVHSKGSALVAFRFSPVETDDAFFVYYCSAGCVGYDAELARILCFAQFFAAAYKAWLAPRSSDRDFARLRHVVSEAYTNAHTIAWMPAGSASPSAPASASVLQHQNWVFEKLQWLTLAGDGLYQIALEFDEQLAAQGVFSTPPLNSLLYSLPNGLDLTLVRLAYYGYHGHLMFTRHRPSWVCLVALLHSISQCVQLFSSQILGLLPRHLVASLKSSRLKQTDVPDDVLRAQAQPEYKVLVEALSVRLRHLMVHFASRIMPGDDAGSEEFHVLQLQARQAPHFLGFFMNLSQPEFVINHDVTRKRAAVWVAHKREGIFKEASAFSEQMDFAGASDCKVTSEQVRALRAVQYRQRREQHLEKPAVGTPVIGSCAVSEQACFGAGEEALQEGRPRLFASQGNDSVDEEQVFSADGAEADDSDYSEPRENVRRVRPAATARKLSNLSFGASTFF